MIPKQLEKVEIQIKNFNIRVRKALSSLDTKPRPRFKLLKYESYNIKTSELLVTYRRRGKKLVLCFRPLVSLVLAPDTFWCNELGESRAYHAKETLNFSRELTIYADYYHQGLKFHNLHTENNLPLNISKKRLNELLEPYFDWLTT